MSARPWQIHHGTSRKQSHRVFLWVLWRALRRIGSMFTTSPAWVNARPAEDNAKAAASDFDLGVGRCRSIRYLLGPCEEMQGTLRGGI